jgi:uncharacterized membrane protein YgaE (UPF0421/DUF939 family)
MALIYWLFISIALAKPKATPAPDEPMLQQITDSTFLGFPSQVYFLAFCVGALITLLVSLYKTLFDNTDKKIDKAVEIGNKNAEQIAELARMMASLGTTVAQLEKNQGIDDQEARNIARDEVQKFHDMLSRMMSLGGKKS